MPSPRSAFSTCRRQVAWLRPGAGPRRRRRRGELGLELAEEPLLLGHDLLVPLQALELARRFVREAPAWPLRRRRTCARVRVSASKPFVDGVQTARFGHDSSAQPPDRRQRLVDLDPRGLDRPPAVRPVGIEPAEVLEDSRPPHQRFGG